jgi:hypothetical protein
MAILQQLTSMGTAQVISMPDLPYLPVEKSFALLYALVTSLPQSFQLQQLF